MDLWEEAGEIRAGEGTGWCHMPLGARPPVSGTLGPAPDLPAASAEVELPMNLEGLQRDSLSPLLSSPCGGCPRVELHGLPGCPGTA